MATLSPQLSAALPANVRLLFGPQTTGAAAPTPVRTTAPAPAPVRTVTAVATSPVVRAPLPVGVAPVAPIRAVNISGAVPVSPGTSSQFVAGGVAAPIGQPISPVSGQPIQTSIFQPTATPTALLPPPSVDYQGQTLPVVNMGIDPNGNPVYAVQQPAQSDSSSFWLLLLIAVAVLVVVFS